MILYENVEIQKKNGHINNKKEETVLHRDTRTAYNLILLLINV